MVGGGAGSSRSVPGGSVVVTVAVVRVAADSVRVTLGVILTGRSRAATVYAVCGHN